MLTKSQLNMQREWSGVKPFNMFDKKKYLILSYVKTKISFLIMLLNKINSRLSCPVHLGTVMVADHQENVTMTSYKIAHSIHFIRQVSYDLYFLEWKRLDWGYRLNAEIHTCWLHIIYKHKVYNSVYVTKNNKTSYKDS